MPIRYQSPAPVALAGSIYADGARRRRAATIANAGAGGYAHADAVGSVPYDTGIQEAIQQRDTLAFTRSRDALDRNTVSAGDVFRAQSAADMQRQRFQLQVELQEVELTQQEKMRLFRMKNAIGAIANDPTWGEEDKAAAISELKTGINPLERRAARERVQAQSQAFQEQADMRRMQSALAQEELKFASMSLEDRQQFLPDPTALAAIAADLREEFGAMADKMPPKFIEDLAKKEAVAQGLGVHGILDQKRGFVPFEKGGAKGGSGGKVGEMAMPSGLTLKAYQAAHKDAVRQVESQAKETVPDPETGGKKLRFPKLEDLDERQRAVEAILFKNKLPANLDEFAAQAQKPEEGGPRGYDPSKASWRRGKKDVAIVATQPGEQGPAKPTEGYRRIAAGIDAQAQEIAAMPIPQGDKTVLANMLRTIKEITARNPDPSKTTPEDAEALVRIRQQYVETLAQAKARKASPEMPPFVPSAESVRSSGSRIGRMAGE